MYKLTKYGHTYVGCNEDAWRTTSRIWFETKNDSTTYGACFTGSRYDGNNGFAPQSGMNDAGLCFSRLASYAPEKPTTLKKNLQTITNPTLFLKDILHRFSSIEEVANYLNDFDRSTFDGDVFLYVDKQGNYLIVEPYITSKGKDSTYVLSNFCPSVTSVEQARKLDRYKHGVDYLKTTIDTSLSYLTAVSDTMHVCRKHKGDGTLLTTIWNLERGLVNVYFYHDYKHVVQFNIEEELAKGNHILQTTSLFPANKEYETFCNYQTPENNILMMLTLLSISFLLFFTTIYFIVSLNRKRIESSKINFSWLLIFLNSSLVIYMYILAQNMYIFYFPAPFVDTHSTLVSISSYLPYLLVLCFLPSLFVNYNVIKNKTTTTLTKLIFSLNNIIFLVLIALFYYWGFYLVY